MKFTLDYLKSLGRRPRVHPNGFVQFDIEPNILRLHVWPAEPIPGHPGRIHPVHNHSFDINSTVIYGALTNDTYEFYPTGFLNSITHIMHEARRINDHDSVLAPVERNFAGYLVRQSSHTYKPTQRYYLDRNVLHDSVPNGLTATLMTLEKPSRVYAPRVAVPVEIEPLSGYSREAYDEGLLWDIISQVL